MIAATVFVLGFVILGLGTVLVAMRSGSRPKPGGPGRSGRRWLVIGLPIVLIVIGIGIPALVLAGNVHHHSDVGPGGLVLFSHSNAKTNTNIDEVHGRHVFAEHCTTCHTLHGANAVGKVGPNLDLLIGGLGGSDAAATKTKRAFILSAIEQGRERGSGQMPAQLVVGREAADVAAFVAAVAGH
jgi:Cytochrome c